MVRFIKVVQHLSLRSHCPCRSCAIHPGVCIVEAIKGHEDDPRRELRGTFLHGIPGIWLPDFHLLVDCLRSMPYRHGNVCSQQAR